MCPPVAPPLFRACEKQGPPENLGGSYFLRARFCDCSAIAMILGQPCLFLLLLQVVTFLYKLLHKQEMDSFHKRHLL